MTYDVDALRAREFQWTLTGENTYLDNAKTGALPARAVAVAAEWARLRAEPFRLSTYQDLEVFRRTRELVAKLIGAKTSEIACMVNTSYGINVAMLGLPLRSGDVVLTYDLSAGTGGGTTKSASITVSGDDFYAETLTIENSVSRTR